MVMRSAARVMPVKAPPLPAARPSDTAVTWMVLPTASTTVSKGRSAVPGKLTRQGLAVEVLEQHAGRFVVADVGAGVHMAVAYAVLQLVQQGRMALDAPVLSYLPGGYVHRQRPHLAHPGRHRADRSSLAKDVKNS